MKKKTLARATAEMIAAELFNYGTVKAKRLVMQIPGRGPIPGPGWCIEAVADKIEETLLRKHLQVWMNQKKIKAGMKKV